MKRTRAEPAFRRPLQRSVRAFSDGARETRVLRLGSQGAQGKANGTFARISGIQRVSVTQTSRGNARPQFSDRLLGLAGAVSVGSRPLPVVVEHDAQIVHEGRVWGLKKGATSEARSAEASVKLALPFMAVVSVIRNFACRSVRVRNSSRTCTPLSAAASRWPNAGGGDPPLVVGA